MLLGKGRFGRIGDVLFPPLLVVTLAFLAGSVPIFLAGSNPIRVYTEIFYGAFGSSFGLAETVVRMIPLLIIGIGLSFAFKVGVWNIGAEGQLHLGALAATMIGITLSGYSPLLVIPIAVVASLGSGALWATIPALMRIRLNVSEIITTLMMNFIAFFLVEYVSVGPFRDPSAIIAITSPIGRDFIFTNLIAGTRLHAGLLIAIAILPGAYFIITRTVYGFELKMVGLNSEAAYYKGIKVKNHLLIAMLISGALAGLAGMIEIYGLHSRLILGFSPGFGFTAIVVALLGRLHVVGVSATAFLLASLVVGGNFMQRATGIPVAFVNLLVGIMIVLSLGIEILERRRMRYG